MSFIADFHIHSHFSRATSKDLAPEHIDRWARIKGIQVVGTGDFTHPGWIQELKEKLIPAEPGLFRLKPEFQIAPDLHQSARFLLTAEISTIYKKRGKVRKIHNVVFAPDFETAEKIIYRLTHLGFQLTADGRPILGMDSRDLFELLLEISPDIFFVPAHIWTPWFSILGEKSGFDSVSECFEDLTPFIYGLETGLSSDPPMNWLCSALDPYVLISNSDAHSPEKLGREANRFDTELSYFAICEALRTKDKKKFLGTIEFFPQEGKYHYDGHRKCGISWHPEETAKNQGICSRCGKPVTIGVLHRVYQLADRREIPDKASRFPYVSVIPLIEILSEIYKVNSPTEKVRQEYHRLVKKMGPELAILLDLPIDRVQREGGEILAEAIIRMRQGNVRVKSGFDGEYGVIRVFDENEILTRTQVSLFQEEADVPESKTQVWPPSSMKTLEVSIEKIEKRAFSSFVLDEDQKQAVAHGQGPAMVIAGPGSGKTRVLVHRIAHLIQQGISPNAILAITFTHKVCEEMRERVVYLLNEKEASRVLISTFHALGYSILCESETARMILDVPERNRILASLVSPEKIKPISEAISLAKQNAQVPEDSEVLAIYTQYETLLTEQKFWDLDDLILKTFALFETRPDVLSYYQSRFQWILVDEFQDVNKAQYQLLRLLAPEPSSCLWVVGDPDQAIYGFRGASPKFIEQFQKDYPNTKIYVLKESYRCPQTILNASGQVLSQPAGFLKGKENKTKVHVSFHPSDRAEAEFVARTIETLLGGVRFFSIDSGIATGSEEKRLGFSDFAVLYRIEKQKEVLESAFCDHGIPFQSVNVEPISQREPFSSIFNIFKAVMYPHVEMYQKAIAELSLDPFQFQTLRENIKRVSVKEMLQEIFHVLRISDAIQAHPETRALFGIAEKFSREPEGFLRWMVTGTGIEMYRPHIEAVSLMTLHSAKGLEWECVFIVGVEDGLLPYRLFENQMSDLKEERRLLYVGMTRARSALFLTYAEKRILFGREFRLPRSPFLQHIDEQWFEMEIFQRPRKSESQQLRLF